MNINDDISFDEWFDIFLETVRKDHKYKGPVDRYGVEGYYDEGETPEYAAELFVKEMEEE